MSENASTGNYIGQAWLVILLALVYGGALAGVHVGVSGRILENKRNETYDQIPQLVPGAVKDQTKEHVVEGMNGKTSVVYEARDEDGARIGWVLLGRGQGFADRIDLLVGLNAQLTTIRGMFVLDQRETPGLGNYIMDAERFGNQFVGKRADSPLVVVKSDPDPECEIQALTGATISSESVADIINNTVANLRQPILTQLVTTTGAPVEEAEVLSADE
jgi:electron transport complex protein RnfG